MFRFIECKIERGGFSSERVFEISLAGKKIRGLSYVDFVCKEDGEPLGDEPPPGESIAGYVQCRVIRATTKDRVLIELPSTELVDVPISSLTAADELIAA